MGASAHASVAVGRTRDRRAHRLNADAVLGLALSMPVVVLMAALVIVPLAITAWESLHRVTPMMPGTPFVGLRNYLQMLSDSAVAGAWTNTSIYAVLAVTCEILGGLGAALLLNRARIGRRWLLAAVILPWALPPVVNAIVWGWIYNPHFGLLNGILLRLNIIADSRVWMNDRTTAIIFIAVVHVWRMMPLTTVIILAALQTIPNEFYEAAKVDGAGPAKTFRSITLPLISSALGIALTQATIAAFHLFDEAWILNGASSATRPIQGQIYMTAFQDLKFSYGMSMSISVMVISIAISAIYIRRVYRETRFE